MGYTLQATHIPKKASKKENKNSIPTTTRELTDIPNNAVIKITRLKIKPIRAAKIFGPALINCSLKGSHFTMFSEEIPNRLYFESLPLRIKKSAAKKAGINHCFVKANNTSSNTVNAPFNRATCSFIFLSDMGQMA